MNRCKVLLIGANGQVGNELGRLIAAKHELTALSRAELDLSKPESIRSAVRDAKPAIIVNTAAYTAVDQAEREPDRAMAINAHAPAVLAEEAKRLDALLVSYSTDYVFDGKKTGPYTEDDTPNPLNVYGSSKLAGDMAVQQSGAAFLIFRVGWVYSQRGKNFLLTVLRLAREGERLRIVDDQIGAPTAAKNIAEATVIALGKISRSQDSPASSAKPFSGVYNFCAAGWTSWCDFAREALRLEGLSEQVELQPIPSSAYPTLAARPMNSRMSTEKISRAFGIRPEPWQEMLDAVLQGMRHSRM